MDSLLSLVPLGIDLSLSDVEEILRYARSLGIKRVSNKGGLLKIEFEKSREQSLSDGTVRIASTVSFRHITYGDRIELTSVSGIEGLLHFTLFGKQVLPWVPIRKITLGKPSPAGMVEVVAEVDAPFLGKVTHEVTLPVAQVPLFKQAFASLKEGK